jgi:hypothetical protein
MTTYHVSNFKRGDSHANVHVIVDAHDQDEAVDIAIGIAGDVCRFPVVGNYRFPSVGNINLPVPDTTKNQLLTNQELYAAVPELKPRPYRPCFCFCEMRRGGRP